MNDDHPKVVRLKAFLASYSGGALVAFSGGVDSTLLLAEAHRALGGRCAAFTADTPSLPRASLDWARTFAGDLGARHFVAETGEFSNPDFLANGPDRCFFCKGDLFASMAKLGLKEGFSQLLYGAVTDDLGDVRPGMSAAEQAGAVAPLLLAGFSKEDVRVRSRTLGLRGWDRPASACLASRVPTGRPIRTEDLARVEAAEAALHGLGFSACRVRLLGDAARVEVPLEQIARLASEPLRGQVVLALRASGFSRVTVDLEGYRPAGLTGGSGNPSP